MQHFSSYTVSDVSEAPDAPGLYAWYGVLDASPPDWEFEGCKGRDVGISNYSAILQGQTLKHSSRPLDSFAKGAFNTSWQGTLTERSAESLKARLASAFGDGLDPAYADVTDFDKQRGPALDTVLRAPRLRELHALLLKASAPVLSAPIYVGVAKSLRQRLRQHADLITKLWGQITESRARLDELTELGPFAARAIKAGFDPDSLIVWTFDLRSFSETNCDGKFTDTELRAVAEAAEWLLNRWHRPNLGEK